MLFSLAALAAAAAAQSAEAPDYDVEVFVQDKRGLFGTRSIKLSETITLEDGSFEISAGDGSTLLEGDISITGDRAQVDMTICRPKTNPCEEIGTPKLSFKVGASAEVSYSNFRTAYEVSFEPE